jgi:hypothetical protein
MGRLGERAMRQVRYWRFYYSCRGFRVPEFKSSMGRIPGTQSASHCVMKQVANYL